MNILITGGYGFIGSHVAERFHKEGHQIYIIDNLSTGLKSNVSIPHKFYHLSVEDRKCDEVFKSISPDVVIHLAAQVDVETSVDRPHVDTQSNILGLVNILRCSNNVKATKFIFASSAAVYGHHEEVSLLESSVCNPVSPYGINKYLGEYYCSKWQQLYGLQTLSFRISNVYGPRQGNAGDGGAVSIFTDRLLDGKEIIVYGDGEQTLDYIYVEDVVDGIYRGAWSDVTGVYNLSSNMETSINQLIEVLKEIKPLGRVMNLDARKGEIYRSSLDNSRVKKELDWIPIYSIQQGLKRTFEWLVQKTEADTLRANIKVKTKSTWWPHVKPFAENLLAFTIVASISLFGSEILQYTSLDFKLIYVILLGILYGTRQSILSAVLASGLYFYESLDNGRDWVSLLYDPEALFVIAMYLFFGLIIGFVSDKSRRDSINMRNELQTLNDKYLFLKDIYGDTRKVKEELQRQLINSKDSIGRIRSIVKALESMEPEEIVTSSVKVLSNLLETNRISVFSVNNSDFLRLMIKSSAPNFALPKTIKISDNPHLLEVVTKGKLFVNKALIAELPMMVSPILHEGQVVAIVSLHDLAFEKLNLNYENLFKVSVDLISGSLSRAFQYVGATRNERYVEETNILKPDMFIQMLHTRTVAKQQYNTDFVLLSILNLDESNIAVSRRISSVLRDSDYLGINKDRLVVLLSNSDVKEAEVVIQRLSKKGVTSKVISEDVVYV